MLDQLIDGGHGDPVVVGQAALSLGHDLAEPDEVAAAEQALGLPHAGAFGDDVTGPPAQHRIGQCAQVAEGAEPEGTPQHVRGPLAFGAPVGVGGGGEQAGRLTVHNDEGRFVGHGHLAGLEGVEVDVQRVAGAGTGDGQGIEEADVGARAALGLLAVEGQRQGIGVVAEGEQQRHREGGTRGEAGADRQGAGDPGDPARRRGLEPEEPGRQGRLGAHRGGVAQHDL